MFRKIASGLFGESQALPRQFCAHFTDTVENPGWFGVALFQVIKCRLAGKDTDRIDSCIDTAGDVCVDAVTDDHGAEAVPARSSAVCRIYSAANFPARPASSET